MINCIDPGVKLTGTSSALNASRGEINLGFPGFEELLAEKTASNQVTRHGFVGDGQDLCPWLNENTVDVINAIMSLTDGLEDIWKIVLRLEKHIDPQTSDESITEELDNAAGRSSAAALLTRLWKKKELSGDTVLENGVDVTEL
ncbi:MAG: hypothetical protein K2J77_02240 [Oscillospiraceae bacterium]|nr:hypothetical protein [Oscillospiraceae bacterium]